MTQNPGMPSRRSFIRKAIGGGVAVSVAAAVPPVGRAQAGGGIRSFDHVSMPMRDTAAMLAFYRALGFGIIEGPSICAATFGESKINLHRPDFWQSETFTLRAPAAEPPCGDFCMVWDGTAQDLEATLAQAGAEIIEGPVPRVGGKAAGTAEGTSRYIRDPDGNLLEFIVY
jgi:catechol 2,3-dioxygenase-like lactoylglutathione lyase family enzyme